MFVGHEGPGHTGQVLRSGVDIVMVTATVLDPDGKLAQGLPREAFEIFEDGEKQTISQFTNERVPVGLGLLPRPHGDEHDGRVHPVYHVREAGDIRPGRRGELDSSDPDVGRSPWEGMLDLVNLVQMAVRWPR